MILNIVELGIAYHGQTLPQFPVRAEVRCGVRCQRPARFGRPDRVQEHAGKRIQGALYPINSKHPEVQGKRAYASIAEIGEPVELVVIATPPQTVPGIIEDCGIHGVKAAVIITAGFGESGPAGRGAGKRTAGNGAPLRHPPDRPELPRHHASVHRSECHLQQGRRKHRQYRVHFAVRRFVHRHSGLGTAQRCRVSPAWCRWVHRPMWISARSSTIWCPTPIPTAS